MAEPAGRRRSGGRVGRDRPGDRAARRLLRPGRLRLDAHVASRSDTVVLDEHRGHRLGLAVKLANLRTLAEELPDITAVRGPGRPSTTHMLAINREPGFRVVEDPDVGQGAVT